MSDLTSFIAGPDQGDRPVVINFTAAGVAYSVSVTTDTDPSTYWAEAAGATANSHFQPDDASVSFDYDAGTVNFCDANGDVTRVVTVVLS